MRYKKFLSISFFLITLLTSSQGIVAAEESTGAPKVVWDALEKLLTDKSVNIEISKSPIAGLYEAVVGTEIIYLSDDGELVVIGDIRRTATGENLTENKRNELRMDAINNIADKEAVVFYPEGPVKYTVNVFTDVDCPYCAKFHQEVSELNAEGVKVRYLAFPRKGKDSDTYKTMVSVWCADDRQQAMTDAKARKEIESLECDNPLDEQKQLGMRVGVSGTPALVLPTGELLPGYMPADRLLGYLKFGDSGLLRR